MKKPTLLTNLLKLKNPLSPTSAKIRNIYIREQLKKNPKYEAWDYCPHITKNKEMTLGEDVFISSRGRIYFSSRNELKSNTSLIMFKDAKVNVSLFEFVKLIFGIELVYDYNGNMIKWGDINRGMKSYIPIKNNIHDREGIEIYLHKTPKLKGTEDKTPKNIKGVRLRTSKGDVIKELNTNEKPKLISNGSALQDSEWFLDKSKVLVNKMKLSDSLKRKSNNLMIVKMDGPHPIMSFNTTVEIELLNMGAHQEILDELYSYNQGKEIPRTVHWGLMPRNIAEEYYYVNIISRNIKNIFNGFSKKIKDLGKEIRHKVENFKVGTTSKGYKFIVVDGEHAKSFGFNIESIDKVIKGKMKTHKKCTWKKYTLLDVNTPLLTYDDYKEHFDINTYE